MKDMLDITKDIIIYKNKLEVKIIIIAISIFYIPFFSYVLINDLITNNEHIIKNIIILLLLCLIGYIPVLVINRLKIIFNFKDNYIMYRSYFNKTKKYNFDDISVSDKRGKGIIFSYDYIFYFKNKKVFKINHIDFETNTKKSHICLMSFFRGFEKKLIDLSNNLKKENIAIQIICHSIPYTTFRMYNVLYMFGKFIDVNYDQKTKEFVFSVYSNYFSKENNIEYNIINQKIIKQYRCKVNELEMTSKNLVDLYLINQQEV